MRSKIGAQFVCLLLAALMASLAWSSDLFSVDSSGNARISGSLSVDNLSVGNLLMCTKAHSDLWIAGNRDATDPTSDIYLSSSVSRSAGNIVEVWNGMQVANISKDGQITAGVVGGTLNAPASFVDGTGASGHVSLTCSEAMYTLITGKLGKNLIDGVYPYGGLHGDVTFAPTYSREAGMLLQVVNTTAKGNAMKFHVDYYGGVGQAHGLSLTDFGSPGWVPHSTSIGTTYTGQGESTLMYAFDAHRWYAASEGAWKKIPFAGDATEYDATDGSADAGCQTINKLKGKAKFAAGTSTLTIADSYVTSNSHVSVVLQSNDATAVVKSVIPTAGSFAVNIVACTADTVFSFVVEN